MLQWTGIAKRSFYYQFTTGKQGRKASSPTRLETGGCVSNQSVVIAIKFILGIEFVEYGYQKMAVVLRADGFIINENKVYRLMTAAGLLYSSKIGYKSSNRKFVQFYTQQASAPMQQLCMDIKYLYIHGAGRNALLLTVLDVYSRRNLGPMVADAQTPGKMVVGANFGKAQSGRHYTAQ